MTESVGSGDTDPVPASSGVAVDGPEESGPTPMDVDSTDEPIMGESGPRSVVSSPAPSPSLLKTPISNRRSDADCFKTPESLTPTSAKKRKRLTPEERNMREKERLEKRRKLEEEKQKKEEEKQKKEEERLEKVRQKEEERVRKEEEKRRAEDERKRVEEEKKAERLKREEEKKQERLKKEEERLRLEEEKKQERLKKEEEKKRKDEEKRQKLEEKEKEKQKIEEKKAKQAQIFTNFFQKSSAPKVQTIDAGNVFPGKAHASGDQPEECVNGIGADSSIKNTNIFNPLPFQIKTGMAVAPLCRRKLSGSEKAELDSIVKSHENGSSPAKAETQGFECILERMKKEKGRRYGRTVVKNSKDDSEVQVLDKIEDHEGVSGYLRFRMKFLLFHENRRPAYWGTWKRKAKRVKARAPLTKEEEVDYDFDSDDEWEDEPEDAEEICDSDKEEKEDNEDGADEDEEEEGWMVPHGYLSDSERDGKGGDFQSLKNKEKEFYKSLKQKASIGFPYIAVDDLSCFVMRLCPVFKSVVTVKQVKRNRKPKPKPVLVEGKLEDLRRSQRTPKVPDLTKENPYAQPPSGFLALELPSDDEEDMDYQRDSSSSESESCSSGVDENCEDDDNCENDDNGEDEDNSEEDLFIPIIKSRPKNLKPDTFGK